MVVVAGQHGKAQQLPGLSLFTIPERDAIDKAFPQGTRLTSEGIRQALASIGSAVHHKPRQLAQFVTRENKTRTATRTSQAPWVAEVPLSLDALPRLDRATYSTAPLTTILLLADPIVSSTRVCVPWTTRGMLGTLAGAVGKHIALVVDGKQKVLQPQRHCDDNAHHHPAELRCPHLCSS